MFLSTSGSGANFGKAAVNTGNETVSYLGAETMGNPQKIYFILQDGSNLELKENYTLEKLE